MRGASSIVVRDECVFVIEDTGIGMNPDELARAFGEFTQADSSTTRKLRRERTRSHHQPDAVPSDGRHHRSRQSAWGRLCLHGHTAR